MRVLAQTDTFTTLQELIAAVLNTPEVSLNPDGLLNESGLDSLAMVILREECEKAFDIVIPDANWLGASTVSGLIILIDSLKTSGASHSAPPTARPEAVECPPAAVAFSDFEEWKRGQMAETLEVGMPLMGIGNLNENALLKHLGDLRWRHITRLTGVPSRDLTDNDRNRLYPAFFYVEIRFPESNPMGSFGENDVFLAVDTVSRFGLSILDGTTYLIPPERKDSLQGPLTSIDDAARKGVPAVRMSNAFVMKFDGAEWLKRSRPGTGILDGVAELSSPPDSYELSKRVQETGSFDAPPRNARPLQEAESVYRYQIQPDRDVNGVGLLYFANYPLFLDLAERQSLKDAGGWSDQVINTRSLVRRKIVYLNNASWRDVMDIRTRSWVLVPQADNIGTQRSGVFHLLTEQKMYRESDGRIMAVCSSEKLVESRDGSVLG